MPCHVPVSVPGNSGDVGLARRHQVVQEMVVDYSIGLAFLGLFDAWLTAVLCLAVVLLFKMLWDIARFWRFVLPLNPITIVGEVLNILGACAIALLAWSTLVVLGVFLPLVDRYALAAALMSGCWTLGASANQFFLNSTIRRDLRRGGGRGRHG
jgi:hypothetical protein